jgi:GDP-mannose 6-dehydrogenase
MNLNNSKTVSVFGLGYVGCVSVACLAKAGHNVIGVEVNQSKVELINKGVATIVEPDLDDLLRSGVLSGNIRATTDAEKVIKESDVILVTVGTPSLPNGELDLSHIYAVAKEVGDALKVMSRFITVAIRSTVKPGTCDAVTIIIETASGKKNGTDFSVVANPEFLREGTAIADYENPPYILIGASDERGASEVAAIYANLEAEIIKVNLPSAEIIKYVNNSWHALKVAFGNEVGAICKELGIESHKVMDLFFRDRVLNISPHYLRPGYAFGGACLPKDLSALASLAKNNGVCVPLLDSIHPSNDAHIERAVTLIRKHPKSARLGFLGVSFKTGTDDVRNSPTLSVISALRKDGYEIRVFDDYVQLALASGRNAATTRSFLGDVESLMVETADELLEHADVVVVAKNESSFDEVLKKLGTRSLVDLIYLKGFQSEQGRYAGLAW